MRGALRPGSRSTLGALLALRFFALSPLLGARGPLGVRLTPGVTAHPNRERTRELGQPALCRGRAALGALRKLAVGHL